MQNCAISGKMFSPHNLSLTFLGKKNVCDLHCVDQTDAVPGGLPISIIFNINLVDTGVLTQLFKALETDQVEVLEDLVGKNGVDVNVCERGGLSLLMFAADCNAVKSAQKLIELGANVNACIEGWTALMYACEKNEDDVLAIALVNAGANYNFPPIVDFSEPPRLRVAVVHAIVEREKRAQETAADKQKGQEEAAKPKESWLHIFLAKQDVPADTARQCAQRLIQQGFYTPRFLARTPPHMFDTHYLLSLGIAGHGLQSLLLQLHAELHALYKRDSATPLWPKGLDA